jgi:hypothetical protein
MMHGLDLLYGSLCAGLDSRDPVDPDVFALRLDAEWQRRRKESIELFEERPDWLLLEWRADLALFEALLDGLCERELWEFCAVLRDRLSLWSSSC